MNEFQEDPITSVKKNTIYNNNKDKNHPYYNNERSTTKVKALFERKGI